MKSERSDRYMYGKKQEGGKKMTKQYTKEFKEDAVRYYMEHKELGMKGCAANLGISKTAMSNWFHTYQNNNEEVPVRGSGNYSSDEAKEIARLKKELRDTKDALDILKKAISILGN